jgi:cobalt-zinc-cadmium efflux system outer membrane protein
MFRVLFLLSFVTATSAVRAAPLSFQSALELATQATPDIALQTAEVEAARSAAIAAGRLPDPKLAVGIENLPATGEDRWSLTRDFMTMRKIGLMQDVPNLRKRQAQSDIAAAAVTRAETERGARILTIRRDAALAWLNRFYVEQRGALFDDLDRENRLFDDAVHAQLAGGRGMPADLVGPKQEAADLADRRDELDSEIAKSKAMLKRWVGAAAEEPLEGDPPALTLDAEHLQTHVHEHPELAVYVPMMEMAQAEVHEAEAMKRPDWGVELAYGRRGGAFSDMVSLQFTLGLPLFPRTRQNPQIEAKRQALNRVDAERESMLRDHTQELEGDLAEYGALTRQVERMKTVRLPLARQKADYQFASYRAGKADLTAVLGARRELIDQQLKQIEVEGQHAAIVAKLYYIYGEGAR